MADLIFEHPRLASIYDDFDGERTDLHHYVSIAEELKAKSIVDIGCGTGSYACKLVNLGYEVTGVDPASASLILAKYKESSEKVTWINGTVGDLPKANFDLAVMTGNVGQVFIDDEDWLAVLLGTRESLKPTGHFVFEIRDPTKRAWEGWTRENTYSRIKTAREGYVEGWCDLVDVNEELVTFKWTYVFESDGEQISSDSTLRFRSKESVIQSLEKAGFKIESVRDAPDRPGMEFVFLTQTI